MNAADPFREITKDRKKYEEYYFHYEWGKWRGRGYDKLSRELFHVRTENLFSEDETSLSFMRLTKTLSSSVPPS